MTTETNISALQAAIVTAIQAQFPALQLVAFNSEDRSDPLDVPACLLDIHEIEGEPNNDPGTDQQAVTVTFRAELVLGFRTANVRTAARVNAAAFAAFLRKTSRWPGGVPQADAIQFVRAHRSDFDPDLDKYEVWQVEWQQALHLGASVWTNEGVMPTEVLGSWVPEIGLAHADKYEPIYPTIPEIE